VATTLDPARSSYVENCAGCHGTQGTSFPAHVPQLRGRVGYFLCTTDSRAYILRLPNVAQSSLSDDALAATMNFVVFGLGGLSAAPEASRFTREEVAHAREQPLSGVSLVRTRASVVRQIGRQCHLPPAALAYPG